MPDKLPIQVEYDVRLSLREKQLPILIRNDGLNILTDEKINVMVVKNRLVFHWTIVDLDLVKQILDLAQLTAANDVDVSVSIDYQKYDRLGLSSLFSDPIATPKEQPPDLDIESDGTNSSYGPDGVTQLSDMDEDEFDWGDEDEDEDL